MVDNAPQPFKAAITKPCPSILTKKRYAGQTVIEFIIEVTSGSLNAHEATALDEKGNEYPVTVLYTNHISHTQAAHIQFVIGLSGISLEQAQSMRYLIR